MPMLREFDKFNAIASSKLNYLDLEEFERIYFARSNQLSYTYSSNPKSMLKDRKFDLNFFY